MANTFNHNDKVVITDGGSVGIGTTSPGYTLQIGSTSANSSAAIIGNSTAGIEIRTNSAGGRIAALEQYFANEGSLWLYLSNTTKVLLRADGNSYFNGGNVGIGTTSPSYKLDVAGYIRANDRFYATNGTNTVEIGSTYIQSYLNSGAAEAPLSFYTGTTEKMRITSAGNVGIGTTSPEGKLDVVGSTINGTQQSDWSSDGISYNSYGDLTISRRHGATKDSTWGYTGPLIDFRSSNTGNEWSVAQIMGTIDSFSGNNHQGGLMFLTSAGGTTDPTGRRTAGAAPQVRMAIGPTGQVYMQGDVGIGTSSPRARLHVNGSFKTTLDGTYDMGILNEYVSTYVTRTRFGRNASGSTSNLEIYYDIAGTEEARITRNYPNAVLKFNKGVDTHMIINASGNVGIGTTSPGSLLHIYGSANTWTRYTNTTSSGHFIDVGANSSGQSFVYSYGTYPLLIGTNGTTQMTVTSAGNVGIGTTSPSYKLQVEGTGRFNGQLQTTQGGRTLSLGDGSYANHINVDSNVDLAFNYNNGNTGGFGFFAGGTTAKFFISNSGNVGIGITSPGAKLHVNGDTKLDGELQFFRGGSEYSNYIRAANYPSQGYTSSSDKYWIEYGSKGGHHFVVNTDGGEGSAENNYDDFTIWQGGVDGDRVFSVSNVGNTYVAGKLGIGTTSPAEKLQVVGNIGVGAGTYNGGVYANSSTTGVDTNWGFDILRTAGQADYSTRLKYYPNTGDSRKGGIWNSLSSSWVLYGDSNNTPNVIIPSGNVGIGTTSPGYKLDVSGGAIAIRGNAPGNSLRFDDSGGTSRNALYVDTSNYLNIGNANYAGVKFVQTATTPNTGAFDGQSVQQAVGTTDEGIVLAAPDAWLAVRVGTTDYAIPMYTTG